MHDRKFRPLAFVVAVAATVFCFIGTAPASAGLLVESATNCDNGSTDQVFSPWYDLGNYFLVPNGGAEDGAAGWDLNGGAAVVDGNESYNLSGAGSHSVRVPSGASATSPTTCVGLGEPTLRFMARKTSGSMLSTLRVEVLVEDNLGLISSVPIGVTGGGSSWSPSPQMLVVANLLPLLPGDKTPVAFRFVPQGGTWQVDDVFVDPPHKP